MIRQINRQLWLNRLSLRCAFVAVFVMIVSAALAGLPQCKPERVGMSSKHLRLIKTAIDSAIEEGKLPGGVVLVARKGKVVFFEGYGLRALQPNREPISLDTMYDLASLTKIVATTTAILVLAQDGKLRLDDKISQFIPEYKGAGKDDTTLHHLLTHTSGLPPDDRYLEKFPERNARQKIVLDICQKKLAGKPGEIYIYSDLGFILLGEIVERVTGKSLDVFTRERIFEPLGMKDTMFNPPEELRSRCAPTTEREGKFIRGEVHDPNSWAQNGVAGHAGLFSTAEDLSIYCQMLLNGGTYKKKVILSPLAVKAMTSVQMTVGTTTRGLGWDISSPYSYVRGDFFPRESFGHTGWTGTSIWISPAQECFVILLSNRNHPTEAGDVKRLRALISNIVASSILRD